MSALSLPALLARTSSGMRRVHATVNVQMASIVEMAKILPSSETFWAADGVALGSKESGGQYVIQGKNGGGGGGGKSGGDGKGGGGGKGGGPGKGSGGGGGGKGQGNAGGWPSTTGNPSGGGRSNNPPSK